ncbi:MAG: peptidyl-prolyl cis-trans isomerase (rotamase) - cyclophilin family [Planctomycetota bacterium]|nr:peptidyl-prolyl cis-trans isomerase (rotamase) - cyclophilin family [Planctomycetota bacterium]
MSDRTREGTTGAGEARRAPRRASRPRVESLEGRALLATLAPIADVTAPVPLGYQVPLDGGTTGAQTYSVMSSNPAIKATVAQGKFLTVGVSHTSSGATDPAFTGSLTFQLFDDLTPMTTSKIEQLVNEGFYTSPTTGTPALPDKNFHRIANQFPGPNDFIVQGGSQSGNGSGSLAAPGFPFADEFNQQLAFTGTGQLAMANAGDDTNDSQFFITTGMPQFLNFQHTIFGQLVAGQSTLQQMTQVAKGADGTTPVNPVLFTSTTLSNTNPDGVIHLDLTGATVGQTSTVTVTARDTSGGTVARSFTVNAGANVDQAGAAITNRPFLAPVPNLVVGQNQTAVFQLPGVATTRGDQLTYGVGGGVTTGTNPTFAPVTNGTATVDANGVVRVTPTAGFTGVINLLVGVRDQVNRSGTGTGQTIENIGNYDTQKLSITVTNGAVVNLAPIAIPTFAPASTNTPTTVQLVGDTANPGSSQTLLFTILTQPSHGTISNFNPTTGTFTYTANQDFIGNDTLTFKVRDVGAPTPNLDSGPATETIVVTGATTGAVRLIDRTLVITPPPKASLADTSTNTILVNQVGNNIQVRVNGLIDVLQPLATALDRIVVYGTKNSDTITVGQEVTLPTTLDGGHGGVNTITAGGGPSTEFGWFKIKNILKGGPANDTLTGRSGFVKFVKSGGNDTLFAGNPRPGRRNQTILFPGKMFDLKPLPPHGTFYKFIGKTLVPVKKV